MDISDKTQVLVYLCLSVILSVCLSIFLSLCLSVSLSMSLSVSLCLSVSQSVYLSACLSVRTVCLFVHVSIALPLGTVQKSRILLFINFLSISLNPSL
jgi:hypothetical protein